jgi:hypothetical protein
VTAVAAAAAAFFVAAQVGRGRISPRFAVGLSLILTIIMVVGMMALDASMARYCLCVVDRSPIG